VYIKETINCLLHTLCMYSFMFYETGVCLSLQFFSEISELQNLINPSVLSKKAAVLLKGGYYVNSAAFCLQNSQQFLFGVVQWIGLYRPQKTLHYFFKNTNMDTLFICIKYLVLILAQIVILSIIFTEV